VQSDIVAKVLSLLASLTLVAALAGCGGDDDGSGSRPTATPSASPAATATDTALPPSATATATSTFTATAPPSETPTVTPTETETATETPTPTATSTATFPRLLLSPEGNRLHVFTTGETPMGRVLIPSHADDPENGRDINGEICFLPGTRRFISGEDTGQPNPPPAWGFFELQGTGFDDASAVQIGRLVTTFQGEPGEEGVPDTADPYGCAFLSDGRLVTTDIGNTASGDPNGQLIIWFPPLDQPNPKFCKLDVTIGTAQGVYVGADDTVYVASARVEPGIHRYRGPFPTSNDASGGCGGTDSTGAPMAESVQEDLFIPTDNHIPLANGIVGAPNGHFYVSCIVNGVIAEYDAEGKFVQRVLQPPEGETLGENPYSTGTPLGLALDDDGNLYYADLGLVFIPNIGPGPGKGSVRRIRFDSEGTPLPNETFQAGFTFPDGVGVIER
jgi:hypothetical protein